MPYISRYFYYSISYEKIEIILLSYYFSTLPTQKLGHCILGRFFSGRSPHSSQSAIVFLLFALHHRLQTRGLQNVTLAME
jgi:hypothetical protein